MSNHIRVSSSTLASFSAHFSYCEIKGGVSISWFMQYIEYASFVYHLVVAAAELRAQDSTKVNAFCSVYVNSYKRERTDIVPGTANPEWNHAICLSLASCVTSMAQC